MLQCPDRAGASILQRPIDDDILGIVYQDARRQPAETTAPDWEKPDWQKIDELLSQIARLAKSEISADDFYGQVLAELRQGLATAGAAIWRREPAGGGRVVAQALPADAWPQPQAAVRTRLIGEALGSGRGSALPPRSGAAAKPAAGDYDKVADRAAAAGNPTAYALLISPWIIEGEAAGAIELLLPPQASVELAAGYLKLLEAVGELLADYERSGQIRELRQRLQQAARLTRFTQAIHAQTELRPTAYTIVNEGRQLLGCDRLSLLVARRSRFRLLAVSGVDAIHPRAKIVALLKRLARAVATVGEPLWFPESADFQGGPLVPQVEAALERFLDESHARSAAVLPLKLPPLGEPSRGKRPGETVGLLVAEKFYGTLDVRWRSEYEPVAAACAQAIDRAREAESVPLGRLLRKMRWLTTLGGLAKVALAAAAVAAVVVALVRVQADFTLPAQGELEPQLRREVFARADGLVSDLHAEHGQKVDDGQLLATLLRPQTDLEMKQVVGELATSEQRLAALDAEKLQLARDTEEQQRQYDQLTMQAEDLREAVKNLKQQRDILHKKQEELEVRSPMDGQVLTWNVRQSLEARPVRRGQSLMTIGNLAGPWEVELKVRDRHVAHLLAAERELGEKLEVDFVLDGDPEKHVTGTIRRVALRTETSETQEPTLAVTVDVPPDALTHPTAGATVTARIHCGRRSVGYVWLHDLIDAVRGWMWF